jgi:outer membrane receptor protein involved in Fe transport
MNSISSSEPLVYNQRWSYGGVYTQDQWRVVPRLTLTYGLRWEWQTLSSEVNIYRVQLYSLVARMEEHLATLISALWILVWALSLTSPGGKLGHNLYLSLAPVEADLNGSGQLEQAAGLAAGS